MVGFFFCFLFGLVSLNWVMLLSNIWCGVYDVKKWLLERRRGSVSSLERIVFWRLKLIIKEYGCGIIEMVFK